MMVLRKQVVYNAALVLKVTWGHYKNRGIAVYVMTLLLVSAVLLNLTNPLTSRSVHGDNSNNNNAKIKNHSSIRDMSQLFDQNNLGAKKTSTTTPSINTNPNSTDSWSRQSN